MKPPAFLYTTVAPGVVSVIVADEVTSVPSNVRWIEPTDTGCRNWSTRLNVSVSPLIRFAPLTGDTLTEAGAAASVVGTRKKKS